MGGRRAVRRRTTATQRCRRARRWRATLALCMLLLPRKRSGDFFEMEWRERERGEERGFLFFDHCQTVSTFALSQNSFVSLWFKLGRLCYKAMCGGASPARGRGGEGRGAGARAACEKGKRVKTLTRSCQCACRPPSARSPTPPRGCARAWLAAQQPDPAVRRTLGCFKKKRGEGKGEGTRHARRELRMSEPPPPPATHTLTFSWRVAAAFFPPSTRCS